MYKRQTLSLRRATQYFSFCYWLPLFLSTLSLRRATGKNKNAAESQKFLSTLSLRRATSSRSMLRCNLGISIHALLAESDRRTAGNSRECINFYPRSPCGERQREKQAHFIMPIFLSTLSLRRATCHRWIANSQKPDFYPRSPCGERRCGIYQQLDLYRISIHALLAESDKQTRNVKEQQLYFYPRSPCGERLDLYRDIAG